MVFLSPEGQCDSFLACMYFWLVGWLVGFLTSSSTTRLYRGRAPRQERLTILCAATHETELGDHGLCLSRSHYTDTDPTSRYFWQCIMRILLQLIKCYGQVPPPPFFLFLSLLSLSLSAFFPSLPLYPFINTHTHCFSLFN